MQASAGVTILYAPAYTFCCDDSGFVHSALMTGTLGAEGRSWLNARPLSHGSQRAAASRAPQQGFTFAHTSYGKVLSVMSVDCTCQSRGEVHHTRSSWTTMRGSCTSS
eukprot:COSAG01_NODE_1169_length_11408_cov_35.108056_4_plen_108_part_00